MKLVVWGGVLREGLNFEMVEVYGDKMKVSEDDESVWVEFERSGMVMEIKREWNEKGERR